MVRRVEDRWETEVSGWACHRVPCVVSAGKDSQLNPKVGVGSHSSGRAIYEKGIVKSKSVRGLDHNLDHTLG